MKTTKYKVIKFQKKQGTKNRVYTNFRDTFSNIQKVIFYRKNIVFMRQINNKRTNIKNSCELLPCNKL